MERRGGQKKREEETGKVRKKELAQEVELPRYSLFFLFENNVTFFFCDTAP